jgi:hypothetical protein
MMLIASIMITAAAASAQAAPKCYDYRLEPASMNCEKKEGNSADFASSCSYTGEKVVQIQVACPVEKPSTGSGSGGGSGGSYGDNCACDHSSSGGWH